MKKTNKTPKSITLNLTTIKELPASTLGQIVAGEFCGNSCISSCADTWI